MTFAAYGDFVRYLESSGELHRVRLEVDPYLEITEIASRGIKEQKPALLFEKVKGSPYPLVINTLASERRCELALQKHPEQLGEELVGFLADAISPGFRTLAKHRSLVGRFLHVPVRTVTGAISQEVVEEPNLDLLPVLWCWPKDGGRFLTLPQVVSYDPRDGRRNIGMYRMHVFDRRTTGMHWQIQKGGGFHFYQAEKLNRPLELAVALGTDPALLMATVAALPENLDEAMFAGFLRGKRSKFVRGRSINIAVPAEAEFILEGVVRPGERHLEGPFGDHFGHYSHAAEFPVFHLQSITRRRNPVYPATVVGIPPMEDKFIGDATQSILGPLVRLLHSEICDMWAYYEAGFHNLLVVAVDQRYGKEAMKTALGLLGLSQLSLTKCVILVSEGVNVKSFAAVMKEILHNFNPHKDFVLLPRVPLDTLDFTSYTMNLGSKMIIDATRKEPDQKPRRPKHAGREGHRLPRLRTVDRRIADQHLLHDALLLVTVHGQGMPVLKKLLKHPALEDIPVIAVVSEDVDVRERESAIWGVFTRFDCERDVLFAHQRLIGACPVYDGPMGIDATWKRGYPEPLRMTDEVRQKVEERWDRYWQ
jgi:UbiD family decarboxylase